MSEEQMIVAIVGIGCVTGILTRFIDTIKAGLTRRTGKAETELLAELKALREVIRQLRHQNNDAILGLDTTVQRLDHRLTYLEDRTIAGTPSQVESAPRYAGQGR